MLSDLTVPPVCVSVLAPSRPRRLLVLKVRGGGGRSRFRAPASLLMFPSRRLGLFSPSLVARVQGTLSLPRGSRHFVSLLLFSIGSGTPSRTAVAPQTLVYSELRRLPSISLICFGGCGARGIRIIVRWSVAAGSSALHMLLHRPLAMPPGPKYYYFNIGHDVDVKALCLWRPEKENGLSRPLLHHEGLRRARALVAFAALQLVVCSFKAPEPALVSSSYGV
ncbi:hypothetical protein NDU88_000974 [Pleurodeles waltl]|uniref:Uncharacterized protein n=1 Tax=Pleurodeles waltl TaxID=8319 RepID=A0AAV7VXQ8_PLEWA|nr:hypothetical protein NDU88_000974 [Pleurodeles waltl]